MTDTICDGCWNYSVSPCGSTETCNRIRVDGISSLYAALRMMGDKTQCKEFTAIPKEDEKPHTYEGLPFNSVAYGSGGRVAEMYEAIRRMYANGTGSVKGYETIKRCGEYTISPQPGRKVYGFFKDGKFIASLSPKRLYLRPSTTTADWIRAALNTD